MTRTTFSLLVGTLVFAISMWFGLLAVLASEAIGIAILGIGLAMTMYIVAGFSEAPEPLDVGFRAALIALGVGGVMFVTSEITESEQFLVLSPLVAAIAGVSFALNPVDKRGRRLARMAAVIPVGIVGGFVYTVDPLIYGVILPLVPLAAVGLAENFYDRGERVIAEDPPGV
jgi:hypothetical protein